MDEEIRKLKNEINSLTVRCTNLEKLFFHFHKKEMIKFIAKNKIEHEETSDDDIR